MTEQEAIAYIEASTWSKSRLGLERTKELLSRVGDPQKQLKFIHIAGSNGKGSASRMLAGVFEAAGYKTGLYISPYILEFRERIQLNGAYIPMEALCRLTERVKAEADRMEDHPSQFELITAIGMLYFAEAGADIVMLEVGMGGALDSTNAIDAPECALIMHIGLEHTEYLGKTLEAITETKCGIFKKGCDAVLYEQEDAVTVTAKHMAEKAGVPLTVASMAPLKLLSASLKGQTFSYEGETYVTPLLGGHQLHNAAAVLTAVKVMQKRGWNLPLEAVKAGLASAYWPARFEVLSLDPLFILDGGHNPQCAEAMKDALASYCPGTRFTTIMGVLADKNLGDMLASIAPSIGTLLAVTPPSPRALEAEELLSRAREYGADGRVCGSLEEAVDAAFALGAPVLAFGSLYMAGDIRRLALEKSRAAIRNKTEKTASLAENAEELSRQLTDALLTVKPVTRCFRMAAYKPKTGEPAIAPALKAAADNFVSIAYPMEPQDGGPFSIGLPSSERVFTCSVNGRPAPDPFFTYPVPAREMDCIVLPAAAFTPDGYCLLGDDSLSAIAKASVKAYKVVTAFSFRETDKLPVSAADIRADAVVTENGAVYPCGKENVC